MEDATTLRKESAWLLVFGQIKYKIKTMALTTFLWEKNSVERFKNRTITKISKNG